MTTANERQFTPSTASITVTWSASSGADNYTIMVTPILPSGQSLVSTTTTSLQLTVLYNEAYTVSITAQNCVAGSNSTIFPLTIGNNYYWLTNSVPSLPLQYINAKPFNKTEKLKIKWYLNDI